MRNLVRNTRREVEADPMSVLLDAMIHGPSNAIERSEAAGQRQLVESDVLPASGGRYNDTTWPVLEAMGVKRLGPVPDDDLFVYVELPAGWKKQATDHSMWSHLVDDKGRERAGIFYKAAHYDRSAHIRVTPRFQCQRDYGPAAGSTLLSYQVTDCGKVVFSTDPVPDPRTYDAAYDALRDEHEGQARAWLEARYPDWRNPAAYWDVE